MATSVISNTREGAANFEVTATLMPTIGFRTSSSVELERVRTTTADGSGAWTLALERQADITPSGTFWFIEEHIPGSEVGNTQIPISVGAANSTLLAAMITPATSTGLEAYLTQAAADARYAQIATSGIYEVINAYDYGARDDYDGSTGTDNTTPINNAIAAAGSRTDFGHTLGLVKVILPLNNTGRYKTTGPILNTKDFVVVEGVGEGVIVENVTNNSDVYRANYAATGSIMGCGLRNISLKGTGTGSRAIYMDLVEHPIIEDVNTIQHPGPSLYMESTQTSILSGCAWARVRRLLCQPEGAVSCIVDKGGINPVFESCRTREAEIAYDFENTSSWEINAPYIETLNRGSAKTGVKLRTTDTGKRRRNGRIVVPYWENCTAYGVDADDSNFVEIVGGQSSGGTDESTKVYVNELKLDGGGIITGLRGNSTKVSSANGRVRIEETFGVIAPLSRAHFVDLMTPIVAGRAVHNSATVSCFDTDPSWTATGTSAPTLTHDITNPFIGRGAKKAAFVTGGNGAAFARARMDNSSQALSAGDPWYCAVAFKADASGECIRFRQVGSGGGSDGQILEALTGTDWQIATFEFAPVVTAGTYHIALELGANLAVNTAIWVGAIAVGKFSSIAFINTEGPTPADGDIQATRLVLGQLIIVGHEGSPESEVTADPGSLVLDYTNGEAYIKNSGTSNTGWKLITRST